MRTRRRDRRSRAGGLALGAAAILLLLASCVPSGAPTVTSICNGTWIADVPGTASDAALTEVSGVAASRAHPGVLWVHNDSGDVARVFALTMTGTVLATFSVTGADASDWEDIAIGPGPVTGTSYVYVGDIGDNGLHRGSIDVYRFPEPAIDPSAPPIGSQSVAADRLTFTYPDGAHNAETLLVDTDGELAIVTKQVGSGTLFTAPANLAGGSTTVLTAAGTVPFGQVDLFVGGDIAPAGDAVLLRTYGSVYAWTRPSGASLSAVLTAGATCSRALASEPQGEAIGFLGDVPGFVTMSEGTNQPIHRYRAP